VNYWITETIDKARRTMVFLHGLTADHTLFDKQIELLSNKYNALVWAAPSHGQSRPYVDFTYPNAAEDLNNILKEHQLDENNRTSSSLCKVRRFQLYPLLIEIDLPIRSHVGTFKKLNTELDFFCF